MRGLQKDAPQHVDDESVPEVTAGNVPVIRPTGPMVRKVRVRLGLTQAEFAKLVGVSGLTVWKWETAAGRITLRRRTLVALAKVRAMGKREAKAALAGE